MNLEKLFLSIKGLGTVALWVLVALVAIGILVAVVAYANRSRGFRLFLVASVTLGSSWYAFLVAPFQQVGHEQPSVAEATGEIYPTAPPGQVKRGEEVYRSNGCVYCHTQQVRGTGGDIPRWGQRRTVARDYLYQSPVQLGSQRKGPDLSNVGARRTSEAWHLRHLYAPEWMVEGSTMPPYRYLFEIRKVVGDGSPDALNLTALGLKEQVSPNGRYELVPTEDAKALVDYLLHLKAEVPLFEAPLPKKQEKSDEKQNKKQQSGQQPSKPTVNANQFE